MLAEKADGFLRVLALAIDALVFIFLAIRWGWLGPLAGIVYILLRDSIMGRSLGKLLVGLKVLRCEDHRPASPVQSFLRNLPFAMWGLLSVWQGFGWILFFVVCPFMAVWMAYQVFNDSLGRHMGDLLARTRVVEVGALAAHQGHHEEQQG